MPEALSSAPTPAKTNKNPRVEKDNRNQIKHTHAHIELQPQAYGSSGYYYSVGLLSMWSHRWVLYPDWETESPWDVSVTSMLQAGLGFLTLPLTFALQSALLRFIQVSVSRTEHHGLSVEWSVCTRQHDFSLELEHPWRCCSWLTSPFLLGLVVVHHRLLLMLYFTVCSPQNLGRGTLLTHLSRTPHFESGVLSAETGCSGF